MNDKAEAIPIGEVAVETGLSIHALRYFEREGLMLRAIPRSSGGQRRYGRADVDWLVLVNRLRDSGMPLTEIRRFADLVRSGPGNETERLDLLRRHEEAVRAKLDELGACLDVIHNKVEVYERHVREGTAAGVWSPET
ncbi:MerR family transcriptional regulator [Salininema proteolyticum]|uniref:MerR family transcriptional regulator n=1 Tax=Salininema proteolyticum TaxID=1607685 RepID=A0ABV8U0L7_9ACTN